jgi:phosphopantothenoylcysteine decarboxylase/phosphopantothenate--cysteine ligase
MGFAIADELASRGVRVTLISGPSDQKTNYSGISRIDVVGAEEMYNACLNNFIDKDLIVMSAAVADFTPIKTQVQKIKKNGKMKSISLKPTRDILKELGEKKSEKQLLVGFALETENELVNAKSKLKRKKLDLIVLNSLNDKDAGFAGDLNKVTIIDANNKIVSFRLKPKRKVAIDIVDMIDSSQKSKSKK